ncbi:unnamed protein product [Bemisia tabaci]|uniref:Uncharacterized protein n=1 Tax=Bemisia tabaci TaxID=7038 RepID=A0A9P0F6I2_BEMTA|nr:unnamed protein product [Bemisia tabaci]
MCNHSCDNFQMDDTLQGEEEEGDIDETEIMTFLDDNQDCEPGSSTPSTPVPDQKSETDSEYDESDLEIEEPATTVLHSNKAVQHIDPKPSNQKKNKNSDVPQTDLTKIPGPSTIRCRI